MMHLQHLLYRLSLLWQLVGRLALAIRAQGYTTRTSKSLARMDDLIWILAGLNFSIQTSAVGTVVRKSPY